MRLAALLVAVLELGACAAPAALAPVSGDVRPIHAGELCPGEGVWLPTELAAYKAGRCTAAELEAADCRRTLAAQPSSADSWATAGLGFALGLVAGGATVVVLKR